MQINKNRKDTMSKIRMNTELRNKLFNKIKNVFENEDTQEREGYLQSREDVDRQYEHAHRLAVDEDMLLVLECPHSQTCV